MVLLQAFIVEFKVTNLNFGFSLIAVMLLNCENGKWHMESLRATCIWVKCGHAFNTLADLVTVENAVKSKNCHLQTL